MMELKQNGCWMKKNKEKTDPPVGSVFSKLYRIADKEKYGIIIGVINLAC